MWEYYVRFWSALWSAFAKSTMGQLVGALLVLGTLAGQIRYGLIEQGQIRPNLWAILWPYAALLVGFFLWYFVTAAYSLDRERENAETTANLRANDLEARLAQAERRYFDEQPQLGMRAVNHATDRTSWDERIDNRKDVVSFIVELLGGRVPESVRFEPIASVGGNFSLYLNAIPFVAKQALIYLTYEVHEHGVRPDPKIVKGLGWPALLATFLADGTAEYPVIIYYLMVRFMDRDEERSKTFELMFDKSSYHFTIMPA